MCSRKPSEPINIPSKSRGSYREENYSSKNIASIEVIANRLKNAAIFAKNELSQTKDLQSPIIITDHKLCSIVVSELKKDGVIYLVVYKNEGGGKSQNLFKEIKDRWRFIFFKNIYQSRIFINCKLLKLMFEECEDCVMSLRSPLIGSCDYLRCKDINLNIRVADQNSEEENLPIPYTRLELCNDFNIMQSPSLLIYIVNSSHNITGTIVEHITGIRRAQHNLGGKLFWDEQEQLIISFSKKEGFASVPYYYALNDISQHIVIKPLEEIEEIIYHDDIGSTPPPSSLN
jgi:hypothetical protein